jgi:hypothetical protein
MASNGTNLLTINLFINSKRKSKFIYYLKFMFIRNKGKEEIIPIKEGKLDDEKKISKDSKNRMSPFFYFRFL